MATEFETQILDIDVDGIVGKLRKLGAKEEDEYLQKRWIFDIEPTEVESTGKWIRLRQAGDKKPTLTLKEKSGSGIDQTKETKIEIDDFDSMTKILKQLDFKDQYFQESKRHLFLYKGIRFTLDTWPMIPTYLEIESDSKEKVEEGLRLLGLTGKDVGHIGMKAIYKKYGIDLHSIKELTF
jgi:adenylate cyclase class 2